jgi:hypothetical protein
MRAPGRGAGPPDPGNSSAARARGGATRKDIASGNGADTTPRHGELQEIVALWWRLACQGMRPPAEAGVILIEGGRP